MAIGWRHYTTGEGPNAFNEALLDITLDNTKLINYNRPLLNIGLLSSFVETINGL